MMTSSSIGSNLDCDVQDDFRREPARTLPSGWMWTHYSDGSGSLKSPEGKTYIGYDLLTGEIEADGHWQFWNGYPAHSGLKDIIQEAEAIVTRRFGFKECNHNMKGAVNV